VRDFMKIIFMGTPRFALPVLEYLIKGEDELQAVFTQPDKPLGRKAVMTPPPVKEVARRNGISVYQPLSLKDGEAERIIKSYQPDLIVVAAYGRILPLSLLNAPKFGAVNVHASLLPKLRGAAPIQWSIINGDKTTGITTMQMDAGLDTGDILVQSSLGIGENETSAELHDRLSVLGASVLKETLERLKAGTLTPIKQDDASHTYASMLSKSDSPIDWTKSATEIHNRVRGLNPWPCACTVIDDRTVKIHKTALFGIASDKKPGTIFVKGNSLLAVCGDNYALELIEIQPEGGKKMTAAQWVCGHNIK